MDMGSINWLAVTVCVIFAMVSGAIWYSPKAFFPAWWKGIGKTETDRENMSAGPMLWVMTIIASFIEAASIAFLIRAMGAGDALSGASAGIMLWLGLIAPTYLVNNLFAGHGWKVWAIETGNHLLNMLVFGAILGAWR
jgi:hypothetical protein